MPSPQLLRVAVPLVLALVGVWLVREGDGVLACAALALGGVGYAGFKAFGALVGSAQKEQAELVRACGFRPCTEPEREALHARVAALRQGRPPETFRLADPVCAELAGTVVHQYFFSDAGRPMPSVGSTSRRGAVREFELVAPFRAGAPFVAVLGPVSAIAERVAADGALGALAAERWSTPERPLVLVDVPPGLVDGLVLLFAPAGTTADQLWSAPARAVLSAAAALGVEHVLGADGHALFTFHGGYVPTAAYPKLPAWLRSFATVR